MRGSLFYTGALLLLVFGPVTLWAISYEDVQSIPDGYRIVTVRPEAQALVIFMALAGFILLVAGAVMEKPRDAKKDLTFNQWLFGRYLARKLDGSPESDEALPAPSELRHGQRLFCPYCGDRDHGTPYCPYCGARLNDCPG